MRGLTTCKAEIQALGFTLHHTVHVCGDTHEIQPLEACKAEIKGLDFTYRACC